MILSLLFANIKNKRIEESYWKILEKKKGNLVNSYENWIIYTMIK